MRLPIDGDDGLHARIELRLGALQFAAAHEMPGRQGEAEREGADGTDSRQAEQGRQPAVRTRGRRSLRDGIAEGVHCHSVHLLLCPQRTPTLAHERTAAVRPGRSDRRRRTVPNGCRPMSTQETISGSYSMVNIRFGWSATTDRSRPSRGEDRAAVAPPSIQRSAPAARLSPAGCSPSMIERLTAINGSSAASPRRTYEPWRMLTSASSTRWDRNGPGNPLAPSSTACSTAAPQFHVGVDGAREPLMPLGAAGRIDRRRRLHGAARERRRDMAEGFDVDRRRQERIALPRPQWRDCHAVLWLLPLTRAGSGVPAATQGIHAASRGMRVRSFPAFVETRRQCPSAPGPFA